MFKNIFYLFQILIIFYFIFIKKTNKKYINKDENKKIFIYYCNINYLILYQAQKFYNTYNF